MAQDRVRFGIGAALVVSVLLHLALIVIGWLLPTRAQTPVPAVEETTLRFDFAPTVPSDESKQPRGEIPIPTRQSQPPTPSEAVAVLDDFVSDPAPADLPPPPVERPEIAPQPIRDTRPTETRDETREGLDIPGQGLESEGKTETTRPEEAATPESKSFDLENALRDFGRTMRQPQPQAKGSQKGLNIPDLPPLPATGFGFGNLEFESRDFDWSNYARQIYMIIWRAWHNRLFVTADEFERWGFDNRSFVLGHSSRVAFTIQKNGQITGVVLETPSGCYPLDDSAVDALREVILPPLPSDFPRGQETVHARFIADGDVRTMRRYLGYLKSQGVF